MTNVTGHQPARRPTIQDTESGSLCNDPVIWWANHLKTTKGRDTFYDGFLLQMNQEKRDNAEALDKFLKEIGQEVVEIKHTDATRKYWAMPVLDAFVIANGIQSWAEIKLDTDPLESPFIRYGVAAAWNDNVRSSFLRFRCLPSAWLAAGWKNPITFTAKGYGALDVIRAMNRHYDLLDAIDASLKAKGKEPLNPPFYEVSVELTAGDPIMRGKKGFQSEVTPVVTAVPDNFEIDYVRKHYAKPEWKEIVASHLPLTLTWSTHESKRMASFKDENPGDTAAETPRSNGNGNRNVPVPVATVAKGDFQGDEDLPF